MLHDAYDEKGRPRAHLLPADNVILGLSLATLLALILRLLRLGEQSLWIDELLTIRQGRMPGHGLLEQFFDDVQSPLPMLVTALLSSASEHEAWLRLPSALLGALSVPLFFEVIRRISTPRAAMFGALLLAIHPMHIAHSQEVRGYAYLVFFGLAATWMMLESGRRLAWTRMPWFVLCGVAAGLSNLQGLFWMGGLALGVAVSGRIPVREWGRWAVAFSLILLLLSPWWLGGMQVHETDRLDVTAQTGEPLRGQTTFSAWTLPYAGFVLSMGTTLGPSDVELHTEVAGGSGLNLPARHVPAAILTALIVVVLVVVGLRALGGRSREVLAWAFVPLILAIVLAMRNVKPFNPRYVIAALPVLLLIVSVGMDRLRPKWSAMALVLWIGLTGVSLQRYWFDPQHAHADVRGAAKLIEDREGPDDCVIVPTVEHVFDFYYRGDSPRSALDVGYAQASGSIDSAVDAVGEGRRFLWYVKARSWFGDPRGDLQESMDRRYLLRTRFELDGVEVLLYDRMAPSPAEPDSSDGAN